MINGRNIFDRTTKNDWKAYDNIRKITTSQGDDHTTGCLLDYSYFKRHYKLIVIYLSKQQALDANPKAILQINFWGKSRTRWKYTNVFHYWRSKRNRFRFFMVSLFCFNIRSSNITL